ncbi:MAG: 16S rRNA (cytidine(1402)-2'-O)-methyltransferase [Candidatus Pacebacteria bacterium]|nr:16S rRNA (cytidine(1402)-2'-O)-methyltransferase [Candidatus Paceibacterota bacterium]
MSALYIIGTPIGNLEDLSFRALRILKEVDLILCEDTRVTKKLLDNYGIKAQALSYHQHSKLKKVEEIIQLLKEGKNLALVSDAGTPGISDPGNKLVEEVINRLRDEVKVIPIPGPSAVTAAASISGFPMDKFIFMGFPPTKRKRKKFFEEMINSKYPVIFYESPYRIMKTLKELSSFVGDREIVVCRELTKKFETTYRGTIKEVIEKINPLAGGKIKGEFVAIVERK